MKLTTEERDLVVDALRGHAAVLENALERILDRIGNVKNMRDVGKAAIKMARDLADSFDKEVESCE